MSARDLAIGLLLGGEAPRNDIFHYILDNMEATIEAPINNKFKYTASLLASDRFEFYNSGEQYQYKNGDVDGVFDHTSYRKNIFSILTAWENNVPLFSCVQLLASYSDYYQYDTYYSSGNVRHMNLFIEEERAYKSGTLAFASNTMTYNFSSGTFNHRATIPPTSWDIHKIKYKVDRTDPDNLKTVIDSEWDDSGGNTGSYIQQTYPMWSGTFSDISYNEVIRKYADITQAVYEANGYTYKTNYMILPAP